MGNSPMQPVVNRCGLASPTGGRSASRNRYLQDAARETRKDRNDVRSQPRSPENGIPDRALQLALTAKWRDARASRGSPFQASAGGRRTCSLALTTLNSSRLAGKPQSWPLLTARRTNAANTVVI